MLKTNSSESFQIIMLFVDLAANKSETALLKRLKDVVKTTHQQNHTLQEQPLSAN
jgi:hypothetical protein